MTERAHWREFLTCLAGIFTLAIGEGAYLVLIVSYLERRHVPVAINGSVMAFLSVIEAAMALAAGFLAGKRDIRLTIIVPALLQGASALILAAQPLGALVWLSAGLNGAGMGIVGVALYAATLERRPTRITLGMAVGWYTALIAAGNGLGALLSGVLTDRQGFAAAFGMSAAGFALMLALMATLRPRALPREEGADAEGDAGTAARATASHPWVWLIAIIAGLTMASINGAFDTLFPVYGLRAGLTLTVIGSLSGLKAFLAAIVRPFSGLILQRVDALRANTWSLLAQAATIMLLPWVGMGVALTALVGSMGLAFGAIRVISATLALDGRPDPRTAGRRIGAYNMVLCLGAIVGPWAGGWLASWIGLGPAIAAIPGILSILYLAASVALPKLAGRAQGVACEAGCIRGE